MRFFLFLFIVFQVSGSEIFYNLPRKEVEIDIENGYTRLKIEDFQYLRKIGKPELPFKPIVFLIPKDAYLKGISYEIIDSTIIPINYPIFPSQKYIPFLKDAKIEFIEPDSKVYSSPNPYPEIFIENLGEAKKGCFRLLTVNVYPIHYLPSMGKIIYYDISIKVKFEPLNLNVKINRNMFEMHKKGVSKIVVNPELIESYRRGL